MTGMKITHLRSLRSHDGWSLIKVSKKGWRKLSPSLIQTRHVIGENVLLVKWPLEMQGDSYTAALRLWVDKNITVPF